MKFSTFKIDKKSEINKAKKSVQIMSKDDTSIFHFNNINEDIIHIVFNLRDEYVWGTKIVGNQMNMPMSQYINTFVQKKTNLMFVEYINDKYSEEIAKYLMEIDIVTERMSFSSETICKILDNYDGYIKQLEMIDPDGEDWSYEAVNTDLLKSKMKIKHTISYLLMLSNNLFISIAKKGMISINTSDINTLINFIEDFPYVENNN